ITNREPTETKNLDIYGHEPLPWGRARDALVSQPASEGTPYFLGTVRPDGRPHSAGVCAVWHHGDIYVVSGPTTRKSRNLAANPACTISAHLSGMGVVLEGEAHRVIDPDTLEAL